MDDQTMIDRWCNSQVARGLSDRTVKRRRSTLERFAATHQLEPATATDIEEWLASLTRCGAQSRGLYLADMRAFYRWALRHDHLTVDPTIKVDPPKRPKYTPRPIPTKHLKTAIKRAPERTQTMLILAGYAGLRAAEIASLRGEDVNHEDCTMRVLGKGEKVRIVELHPLVAERIPEGTTGPVIPHERHKGEHVSPGTVSKVIARFMDDIGFADYTGHQARHSFGTRLYAACKDLVMVQEQLGHASPQTTRAYVAFSRDQTRAAIRKLD